MSKPRILINVFHPNLAQSRGNRLIAEQLRGLENATVRDLYALYPDWKIDVKAEQKLLLENDLIVFQHPFYWYSCTPLMKLWLDEVFEYAFAYPAGVGDALRGKAWLSSITVGGPLEAYRSGAYNNWTISELMRPFQQAASMTGMKWLPPFVKHGVFPNSSDTPIVEHGQKLREYLAAYSA